MSEFSGKTIGKFQLLEVINETGNSLVYKGFQPSETRYVAVKILKPSAAKQPAEVQRFHAQGDMHSHLQHPRILEVYETGKSGGVIFRATHLAENGSLQDHLAFGTQNPFYEIDKAIALFHGVVEGLETIHARGYIHGNLKPGNILLNAMMQPLLSDFGVVGNVGRVSSPFLAPEQVQGGVVDRRADVYSLGVLLYTVLVGDEPPAGVVASPRSRRLDLPESVDMLIFKAMAQNPDQRFQSANEFLAAMQSAFTAPPPAAPPVFASMPSVSQSVTVHNQKKGTTWVGIVIGIFLVMVLCIGAVLIFRPFSQNQVAPPVEPIPPAEQPPSDPMPTQRPPLQLPVRTPGSPGLEFPDLNLPICDSIGLVGVPLVIIGARKLRKINR